MIKFPKYFKLSEYEMYNGKKYVLSSYKYFFNTSKGFELSGTRFICSEHGFRVNSITTHSNETDIFGGYNNFYNICDICKRKCNIEKSQEFEIRRYPNTKWEKDIDKEEDEKLELSEIEFESDSQ